MKLRTFTKNIDMEHQIITSREVNRPGLEMAGYFEHFAEDRVQIIGTVEHSYILSQPDDHRKRVYEHLCSSGIPCVIVCRNFQPEESFLKTAEKYGVPVLGSGRETSSTLAATIRYLSAELAPSISLHGVLIDVYGEGVLITGESGIGKSEAALELIRRGHRLVSDDVVEIRRVEDETLIGSSPAITQYFIELRGIGIIDVKTLFGVESIKEKQDINMVIKLEEWDQNKEYDRLGLSEDYMNILDVDVICYSIPVRPGRNLAVIIESAAVNHRQKEMGYNAAQELYRRVTDNLGAGKKEEKE